MPTKDLKADDLTAETMRENFRLRQQNESLRQECKQLAAKAGTRNGPNADMVKALLAEAERSVGSIVRQADASPTVSADGPKLTKNQQTMFSLLHGADRPGSQPSNGMNKPALSISAPNARRISTTYAPL